VCFVDALSRPKRVVNAGLKYPCENLSCYVLGHFGFHRAKVCICTISRDSARILAEWVRYSTVKAETLWIVTWSKQPHPGFAGGDLIQTFACRCLLCNGRSACPSGLKASTAGEFSQSFLAQWQASKGEDKNGDAADGHHKDQKAQAKRRDDSEPGVWTLQRLLGRATTRWRSAAANRE